MRRTFYFIVFALYFAEDFRPSNATPPFYYSELSFDNFAEQQTLSRMARQAMPNPPAPPQGIPEPPSGVPSPPMQFKEITPRTKREAKGGGSMPTRKG